MPDLSKLNICFIAGTLGCGGAERQLAYMLRALRDEGSRVRVLSLTEGEFWDARFEARGIEVVHVGTRRSRPARALAIIEEVRRQKPHIVQSAHFFTNLYASAAARGAGAIEIGALRSQVANEVQAVGGILGRQSLVRPRILCANSLAAVERAVECGIPRERLRFLPNVVDTEWYSPKERTRKETLTVLGVGSLRQVKRFDLFLNVIARLRNSGFTQIRGIVVGDGPERDALLAQRDELELNDVVSFPGAAADMRPWYAEADVFLSTSDVEGTPNVLLEAMACGVPVVATDVGDVSSVLPAGFGIVAPAGDELGLTLGLSIMAQSEQERERYGSKGRSAALLRSVPSLRQTLRDLYRSVLPGAVLRAQFHSPSRIL